MENIDLGNMSKAELENQLYKEITYYAYDEGELSKLCHILTRELPRKFVMRIISKMYRLRTR